MGDRFPPSLQRPRLLALASALEISLTQLRRDDCGDWAIIGRRGRIYALPVLFQILITGWHTRGWNACKADFEFAYLTQDGDEEGAFTLEAVPISADQADKIRKWAGLKKRRQFDDGTLAALRERGKALGRARQDAQTAAGA